MPDLAATYADGGFLDAKWEVMRRHRTSVESFEEWLLRQLPPLAGLRILDVGAGSGRFALPLARAGARVVALDVLSEVMTPIREARTDVEIVVADARDLPPRLGRFDVILAAHMLYHLDDIAGVVRSWLNHLAPSGLVVATTNRGTGMRAMFELHLATMRALGLPAADVGDSSAFTAENGAAILRQVFADVRAAEYDGGFRCASADPVFTYYAATELYRAPMRDGSIPLETRLRIAPTYVHLAQRSIDEHGPLHVRKDMMALFCH